jgi:hypothetical protein
VYLEVTQSLPVFSIILLRIFDRRFPTTYFYKEITSHLMMLWKVALRKGGNILEKGRAAKMASLAAYCMNRQEAIL